MQEWLVTESGDSMTAISMPPSVDYKTGIKNGLKTKAGLNVEDVVKFVWEGPQYVEDWTKYLKLN